MRHTRELLAGLTLTASMAVGITACGGRQAESKPAASTVPANRNGEDLQKAAGRLIQLAEQSPTRYEDKPPYTIGFTVSTDEGGSLSYEVQTATQQRNASQTEMIGIEQTGPNEANFNLTFYADRNGLWDMICSSNPFSAHSRNIEEVQQQSIQLNGKTVDNRAIDANAILSDEINSLNGFIGTAAAMETNARASTDTCNVNLG